MTTTLAPGLARKVKKVLETRIDSPELLSSLAELSNIYPENTQAARRGLRSTIEKRGLLINEEFLQVAESAQAALEEVEQHLEGLAKCCTNIGGALESSRSSTESLVKETEKLKKELETNERRSTLVGTFLQSYQLSAEEVAALREGQVDPAFFDALDHVKDIHKNCKMLLRTHHQRAGLELMDVMAMYQETAYERLCRWVQGECRSLGEAETEVWPLLQRATQTLRGRPVLFKYCAEEVASHHHNALFRRFIAALTRGGPGGMPRPIEMHSHDPRRYVGDMLGWLHQALASENELMNALFAPADPDAAAQEAESPRAAAGEEAGAEEAWDNRMIMDRIFEGVCRPFKVRVEQVLTTVPGSVSPSALLTFRLTALLHFYLHTFAAFLPPSAALATTLKECVALASRTFFDVLKAKGEKMVRQAVAVARDLSPPAACSSAVHQLMELMETPDASMLPPGHPDHLDFEPVVAAVLDPLLQMCDNAAATLRPQADPAPPQPDPGAAYTKDPAAGAKKSPGEVPAWAPQVYLINCLAAVQGPLSAYPIAARKCEEMQGQMAAHVEALVAEQAAQVAAAVGLADKLAVMEAYSAGEGEGVQHSVMSADPALAQEGVVQALNALFARLSQADGGLPEFEQMQVPRVRDEATSKLATKLVEAYEFVYTALMDPANGYDVAKSNVKHTPAQLRTICSL